MSHQEVFHSFLLDDSKQDSEMTAAHSKHIMELLQNRKVLITNKGTIWDNKYGCGDQYRCATALYSLSMFYHAYNILIYCDFRTIGHGKYVAEGLNSAGKSFLTILMKLCNFLVQPLTTHIWSCIPQ